MGADEVINRRKQAQYFYFSSFYTSRLEYRSPLCPGMPYVKYFFLCVCVRVSSLLANNPTWKRLCEPIIHHRGYVHRQLSLSECLDLQKLGEGIMF